MRPWGWACHLPGIPSLLTCLDAQSYRVTDSLSFSLVLKIMLLQPFFVSKFLSSYVKVKLRGWPGFKNGMKISFWGLDKNWNCFIRWVKIQFIKAGRESRNQILISDWSWSSTDSWVSTGPTFQDIVITYSVSISLSGSYNENHLMNIIAGKL